jgi:hypothetical protein
MGQESEVNFNQSQQIQLIFWPVEGYFCPTNVGASTTHKNAQFGDSGSYCIKLIFYIPFIRFFGT